MILTHRHSTTSGEAARCVSPRLENPSAARRRAERHRLPPRLGRARSKHTLPPPFLNSVTFESCANCRKLTGCDVFIEWSSLFDASTNSPPSSAGPCLFKCETLPERREPACGGARCLVGNGVAFLRELRRNCLTPPVSELHAHQYPSAM